jgi:hypothetical protein
VSHIDLLLASGGFSPSDPQESHFYPAMGASNTAHLLFSAKGKMDVSQNTILLVLILGVKRTLVLSWSQKTLW